MAIDVIAEKVISLAQAANLLPRNSRQKKVSYCTLWRWIIQATLGCLANLLFGVTSHRQAESVLMAPPNEPDLAAVAASRESLPAARKSGVLAMLKASGA